MKPLSDQNAILSILFPIAISLLVLLLIIILFKSLILLMSIILIVFLILTGIFLNKLYSKTYNVFYDSTTLLLKNKLHTRKIELHKISLVKLTLGEIRVLGFQFYEYRINFKNEHLQKEMVKIYILNSNKRFWDFQDMLKVISPNTLIENHTRDKKPH